jgi:hypothetical protein
MPLDDWSKAKATRITRHRPTIEEVEQHWCKPRHDTLKCYVDVAACDIETNQFYIGACLRDANGKVLKAM